MNVLILGSGGREHALGWKIRQSPLLNNLYIAPGNAGTGMVGKNLDISVGDFEGIRQAIIHHAITLLIVGPEDPLVNGIRAYLGSDPELRSLLIVGPSAEGAMLEGSKDYAKRFMLKHGIPTAAYRTFGKDEFESGKAFLKTLRPPYVLKADGLAAGKGVVILDSLKEAGRELKSMLEGKFGKAGNRVVIEEFLAGIELSVFVLTDGRDYVLLPEAKDYKRIGEGDTGLNTGGMGAVSPVPFAKAAFMKKVEEKIIRPTIAGIAAEEMDYRGFLFFGLMAVDGEPYVIEYNARMGDPETEVVMPRIKSDILPLLIACAKAELKGREIAVDRRAACTVMLVSGGYPGSYEKDKIIRGLGHAGDSVIFHAGTRKSEEDVLTSGGRVLSITSYGKDMKSALKKSYEVADKVDFEKKYFRRDIGFDL